MVHEELPAVVRSLLAAVQASPEDVDLRLHVAEVLLSHDLPARAAGLCSEVLALDPGNAEALRLLGRATDALRGTSPEARFDWSAREQEVADLAPPAFVEGDGDARVPTDELANSPDVIASDVRLDDVGGMAEVKRR